MDTLVNLGVGGETSGSFITHGQLARALSIISNRDNDVRVVTLDIGGNDLVNLLRPGQACYPPTTPDPTVPPCSTAVASAVAHFPTNFEVILSALEQGLHRNPGRECVFVMTYYNPFSGTEPFSEATGLDLRTWDAAVAAALVGTDGGLSACRPNVADLSRNAKFGINDAIACIGPSHGATIVDIYPAFLDRGPVLTGILTLDPHPTDTGYEVITHAFEVTASRPSE